MGLYQSKPVSEWSAQEVAAEVSALGQQYSVYSERILENALDGTVLQLMTSQEIRETFDDLDIGNRLHRRVLEKKLLVLNGNGTAMSSALQRSSTCPVSTISFGSSSPTQKPKLLRRQSTLLQSPEKSAIMAMMAAAAETQAEEYRSLVARQASLQMQVENLAVSTTQAA